MSRRSHRPAAAPVALLALMALAGCGGSSGGDDSGASNPSASSSGDDVTGSIVVLAASSLTESFTALGKTFESEHPGSKVTFSFAASSELASQIEGGAPADVFASASGATMEQVSDTLAGGAEVFVRNSLEIAVPAGNPAKVTGLADFAKKDLTIALCAPEVPCGAAATKVFEIAKITPAPDTLEADVKATLAKVTLGEVDAALVYKTDVRAAGDKVEGIDFPEASQAINDYPIAVLKDSKNAATAQAFVDLVRSAEGASVLTAAGFDVP
jgi:molybdate transport system substrate-binding protein